MAKLEILKTGFSSFAGFVRMLSISPLGRIMPSKVVVENFYKLQYGKKLT